MHPALDRRREPRAEGDLRRRSRGAVGAADAAAGLWQKWNNNNGDVTGNPLISLSDVAAAHTGLDVVRMLALGADCVMLGRAFIYALAPAGEDDGVALAGM